MGVKVSISRATLDGIVTQAAQAAGEECCGLLCGRSPSLPNQIDSILPAANIAADRRRRFEIDPAVLVRAHRAARTGGSPIVGCYHSHPGGDPTPSAEDAAQAAANGSLWLICAGPPWSAALWRAVPNGSVQGRFDPVTMIVDSPNDNGDNPGQ